MAKSTKTYEERIRALEKKEQESIEATKKLIAHESERNWKRERKPRKVKNEPTGSGSDWRVGVESVLGCPIEEEDLPKLIGFFKKAGNKRKVFLKGDAKRTIYRHGGSVMADGVGFHSLHCF